MMKPLLILGIGNILLRDEGIGVHVIEAIEARVAAGTLTLSDDVDLYDGGTFGIDLIDIIADRRRVVCIDAVQADIPPATVIRFTSDEMARKDAADMSLHQVGLLETLEMARQLGCAPKEVILFGVAPKELSPGLEMTPEVSALIPRIIDLVLKEIERP
jgi:hydrogenase maturation protease